MKTACANLECGASDTRDSFFVLFFAAWGYATLGGYVSKTFLASPFTMVEEGWLLLTRHGFLADIGITIWRVVGGFLWRRWSPCRSA